MLFAEIFEKDDKIIEIHVEKEGFVFLTKKNGKELNKEILPFEIVGKVENKGRIILNPIKSDAVTTYGELIFDNGKIIVKLKSYYAGLLIKEVTHEITTITPQSIYEAYGFILYTHQMIVKGFSTVRKLWNI